MTVNQLIGELEAIRDQFPVDVGGDLPVHFGYDYGDRAHTIVCPEIDSVDSCTLIHSDYHNENRFASSHEDGRPAIVLRR